MISIIIIIIIIIIILIIIIIIITIIIINIININIIIIIIIIIISWSLSLSWSVSLLLSLSVCHYHYKYQYRQLYHHSFPSPCHYHSQNFIFILINLVDPMKSTLTALINSHNHHHFITVDQLFYHERCEWCQSWAVGSFLFSWEVVLVPTGVIDLEINVRLIRFVTIVLTVKGSDSIETVTNFYVVFSQSMKGSSPFHSSIVHYTNFPIPSFSDVHSLWRQGELSHKILS